MKLILYHLSDQGFYTSQLKDSDQHQNLKDKEESDLFCLADTSIISRWLGN